jgi:hypothetical protein
VRLDGHELNAMCAVDALGVGAMFGRDVAIESACRACGRPIHIETGRDGTELQSVSPAESLVWIGLRYAGGCAATSLCTTIALWCCAGHLRSWREDSPGLEGHRLTVGEALEVGVALFSDRLAAATPGEGTMGGNDAEE